MDMNLKAFMKAELKDRGTIELPGIKKFVDEKTGEPIPFILKKLNQRDLKEIRNLYKTKKPYKDKNGRPMVENGQVVMLKDYDSDRAGLHIMVECFLQPKLDDEALMDFYGVNDRLDMPEIIFADREDFAYANECVMIACGLKTEETETDVIDGLKN